MKHMQKRTVSQVTELQGIAEVQFNKANRLDSELSRIRKENKDMRRQVHYKLIYCFMQEILLYLLCFLSA